MRFLALVLALLCAFFVFYTVRLYAVTDLMRHTRVGGGGALVGAVVFPMLALAFGWSAVRTWRRATHGR